MTINFDKTNYILLKNPQNHYTLRENSIILNKSVLKSTTEIKFLGLLIDPHLNWSAHISKILKDLRPVSRLFYNLSQIESCFSGYIQQNQYPCQEELPATANDINYICSLAIQQNYLY